jgi:TolB-like protein
VRRAGTCRPRVPMVLPLPMVLRLVNTADGFRLWTHAYNVPTADLRALQDTTATQVAARIGRVAAGDG